MSTRWYPLYQKGNPQLRVFLPNFWMKLVHPEASSPKNIVQFHCSMEMTRIDIKNYLEKIYKVPVMTVHTRIALGKTKKNQLGHVIKEDDIKVAYVHLPKNESFQFPNLFDNEKKKEAEEKEKTMLEKNKSNLEEVLAEKQRKRPGYPSWFSF